MKEEGADFGDVLEDWRVRCALYFCKVFIAMLSFPFLVFALPLASDWLTHVKASGYDKAANCVQKYSSSQIKVLRAKSHANKAPRRAVLNSCLAASHSLTTLSASSPRNHAPRRRSSGTCTTRR